MKNKVLIIAEAGVNHNGSLDLARKLIQVAADAGADIVKFQTFKAANLVSKSAIKAEYQKKNHFTKNDTQFEMLKKLEMDEEMHKELVEYCKLKRIVFMSTGFDEESNNMLDQFDIPFYKIPSGEITNKPYLEQISSKGKPVIISSGMADLGEIEAAIKIFLDGGLERKQITILHCNTEYPTPMEDVNLKAMLTIKEAFKVKVGYSDHTKGIEVPIAAVALGAEVIEKHFTLDRNMIGPDHKASIEPMELKLMVDSIRNIEKAISGDGIKQASKSETPNKIVARKSIHLGVELEMGEKIEKHHLVMKRPGDGISPMMIDIVIGRKIKNYLPADHKLAWEDFQ